MVNDTTSRRFLLTCLFMALAGLGCDEDRPPTQPVPWGTVAQDRGQVQLILTQMGDGATLSLESFASVTLTRYTREAQDEGVTSQRWPGDTSGQIKYIETGQWVVPLRDFPEGVMPLEPGFYQFKHNSVAGQPPSGFYGNSDYFEVKAGEDVAVKISLNAAI